jgi:hypothetical protein
MAVKILASMSAPCYIPSMSDFQPWSKYPSLTRERLSIIANIIRRVRSETVMLHDPLAGDNEWSLGCRAYSRICFAIRSAAKQYAWLTTLHESEELRFSFVIGEIPFRFYTGEPDDPPGRYIFRTFGELQHLQSMLPIEGLRTLDKILRLAIETDSQREVTSVTLVEMDQSGQATEKYSIPFDVIQSNVEPLQVKPIDLPPPTVEPLKDEETQRKVNLGKRVNERKLGSS